MSTFMCSVKTISRLAVYLASRINGNDYNPYMIPKEIPVAYVGRKAQVNAEDIFESLAEMNVKALKARYGEDDIDDMLWQDEQECLKDIDITNLFQVLKSMDCYLYQCNEGDVVNSTIYIWLMHFEKRVLTEKIIGNDGRYAEAEWG